MKRPKHKRKYLVNTRYQFRELGLSLAANMLVALLMALLLSWFYLFVMDGGVAINHNRRLPVYLAVATLVIALLTAFWSLHKSRSVAGMMKKIDMILKDASRGIFPVERFVFRKGDYFAWLANPLNDCLVRMQKQQKCIDGVVPELEDLINKVKSGTVGNEDISSTLDRAINNLKNKNV